MYRTTIYITVQKCPGREGIANNSQWPLDSVQSQTFPFVLFIVLFVTSQQYLLCRSTGIVETEFHLGFHFCRKPRGFAYSITHIRKQYHLYLATRVHILFCACVFFFIISYSMLFFPSHKQKRVYRHRCCRPPSLVIVGHISRTEVILEAGHCAIITRIYVCTIYFFFFPPTDCPDHAK